MNDEQTPARNPDQANISIDPTHRPVLFTDSVLINSTPFGVTLDFAQTIGGTPNQHVVARIGMSAEHAKKLIQELNDHIDKNER